MLNQSSIPVREDLQHELRHTIESPLPGQFRSIFWDKRGGGSKRHFMHELIMLTKNVVVRHHNKLHIITIKGSKEGGVREER